VTLACQTYSLSNAPAAMAALGMPLSAPEVAQARITVLWQRGPGGPEGFYLRLGFVPIGELFGEVVGAKDI